MVVQTRVVADVIGKKGGLAVRSVVCVYRVHADIAREQCHGAVS